MTWLARLEAVALASELGMRPLVARCHLGLGKLYPRISKLLDSHEHLIISMTMLRDMGMTYWLDQAETELRKLASAR